MAQASPLVTSTPKQLGKHLRAVRRKKGLSLSEVARGAGLSRRELVGYERGKVPIPESDLWVIAGSCGVDVSELLPAPSTPELERGTSSIGETVAQLRRTQNDAALAPYLATLQRLHALPAGKQVPLKDRERESLADALGGEPTTIEERLQRVMHVSPEDAARLRSMILPPAAAAIVKPRAIEAVASPMPAPADGIVDVFEELARLPEPLPLPDPGEPLPDLLAPPPVPEERVEVVEGMAARSMGTAGSTTYTAIWSGEDAPPIDIAARQADDGWSWTSAPLATRPAGDADAGTGGDDWREAEPWTPPPPEGLGGTPTFWEGTDDWVPFTEPPTDITPDTVGDANADDPWNTFEWPRELQQDPPSEPTADTVAGFVNGFDRNVEEDATGTAPLAEPPTSRWEHDPDPAAVSTGFYVDWGTESDGEPSGWYAPEATDARDDGIDEAVELAGVTTESAIDAVPAPWTGEWTSEWTSEPLTVAEPYDEDDSDDEDDLLPPIFWRASPELTAPAPAEIPDAAPSTEPFEEEEPLAEPAIVEEFVTAGLDWELGNALPLVEVRGQGALVMRRADERWALADVTTTPNYALEVDVDFRSGPGLGVLFSASVDSEGRMSGYSFDVDPIYDGGGFLVRQWQADRELWNPIARVSAGDPTAMYGQLTIRLVVHHETLVASVNGTEVLMVENLKQASADRGRDAASGDRVGVQAWSSSDLVIDTLRVASH